MRRRLDTAQSPGMNISTYTWHCPYCDNTWQRRHKVSQANLLTEDRCPRCTGWTDQRTIDTPFDALAPQQVLTQLAVTR